MIVATSIAESSLTVPGVRLVVDSGLSRLPRRDTQRGMTGLVTTTTPRASAVQRAGRATRVGPGTVIRCLDERTFAAAPAFAPPEIRATDLTDAALLLACWGSPGGRGLTLPDPLPPDALAQAVATLQSLGAVTDDGRATEFGHRLARIPADPRWARALVDAAPLISARLAADIIAMVSRDLRADGGDLSATLRELTAGRHPQAASWRRESDRLARLVSSTTTRPAHVPDDVVGMVLALATPDRIARRVSDSQHGSVFLLASGTRAGLSGSLAAAEWIVAADVARADGRVAAATGAVIRAAAALDEQSLDVVARHLRSDRVEVTFAADRVVARREVRLGAIVRSSTAVRVQAGAESEAAVARAIAENGLDLFAWSDEATQLRARLALVRRELGEPWPDVSDAALIAGLDEWLAPEIAKLAGGASTKSIDLTSALRRLLPWPEASRFDELVPERLAVPSGSRVRVTYSAADRDGDMRPVVAVKLQECFGLLETPRLVQGRVPVVFHLLSPAGRPLAVTSDLASFWAGAYAQVRAENRGRYPKHPWPEDPLTAVPTALTKRRLGLA